jgi:hypothetical protein
MDARFNCVSLTKKTVSNEQRSMNPPGLPWFHLGRRRRPCSSMGSFLRRTDDCRRLSTLETSDLSSAETCLASFFRVAEFHVLSERLVNWTLFFPFPILRSHRSFHLQRILCLRTFFIRLFPVNYCPTILLYHISLPLSFCRPGDRHCSSAAAPPPSRPPEANDLARRSALSSPLLAPPLFPSGAYQKTETLSTTN